jgi:hypothetical protein
MRLGFLLIAVSIMLAGCGLVTVDERLDVNSPQALNGVWTGVLAQKDCNFDNGSYTCVTTKEVTVRLELTATTIDAQHYSVSGTLQLGDEEELSVTGEVRAGNIPAFYAIGTPSIFEGKASSDNQVVWELEAYRFHDDGINWSFAINEPEDFNPIFGEITRP